MYHILALIAAILWSIQAFFVKYSNATPVMASIIMGIVALVLSSVLYLFMKPQWPSPDSTIKLVLAGISVTVGTLLYFYALSMTKNTSVVVAISFTSPLFAAIIGYLFYKEMLTFRQMIGSFCIIIGIILISSHRGLTS